MRTQPTRSWRGVSADDRRAQRRARFIEAGLEIIGTKGWANTTVQGVCRESGLTQRYFYDAFADRDALLIVVFEQIHDEALAGVVDAVRGSSATDTRSKAREAIAAGLAVLLDDPRKGRILMLEGSTNEVLQQRRRDRMSTTAMMLSMIAQEHFATRRGDPTDVLLTAHAIVGAETELVTTYLSGRFNISR
ncbi:MAG TPA: TetR family transcriptional regulator, partial [Mycobacterium sp.]|nr:TetR family transcriptional regulator [Mycobacterium sp.]